jgi:DNA-binding NarL/FixJ family response regulator
MKTIEVAIIDDHKLFREGIKFLFKQMPGVSLKYEASSYNHFMEQQPEGLDVLLLDLDLPDKDGIEIVQLIKETHPNVKVIILSMHSDPKMMAYLMELGASSYLLKDCSTEELEEATKTVHEEGFFLNAELAKAMVGRLKKPSHKKPKLSNTESISEREKEVLELICQQFTAKEIAEKLFISQRTAEGHRKRLIEKMGVKNTAGLIVKAIKEKIIEV